MRRTLRRLMPAMFHRRLLLLVMCALTATAVLAVQTVNLTIVQGDHLRTAAESILSDQRPTPTTRGSIRDRYGRILVEDNPSYNIAVKYDLLTGTWAEQCARRQARKEHPIPWRQLDDVGRHQLVERYLPTFEHQVNGLWRTLTKLAATGASDLEKRRTDIVRRVDAVAMSRWRRLLRQRGEELAEPIEFRDVAHERVREQTEAHELVEAIDDAARFEIERRIAAARRSAEPDVWQTVRIVFTNRRKYRLPSFRVRLDRSTLPGPLRRDDSIEVSVQRAGWQIVGAMRDRIWKEDRVEPYRAQLPDGSTRVNPRGYLPDDSIGVRGIERAMESHLRGARGSVTTYRDHRPDKAEPPIAGRDVDLAIDIQLQARIAAIMSTADPADMDRPGPGLMRAQSWHRRPKDKPLIPRDGKPLCGAAVVLEVKSGHVLAAVSVPSQSPDELADDADALRRWRTINRPYLNRAVAMRYPPGSTIKPLVLTALYTEHRLAPHETLSCAPGHRYPDKPDQYRCWYFKSYGLNHGQLDGPDALKFSCNVWFFHAGQSLGASGLRRWFERFGLGRVSNSGLPEEIGTLGAMGISHNDAAMMAIGQGPIEWTPLQAAAAYATLARGGIVIAPTFIKAPTTRPRQTIDLQLDPIGVELALEGLRRAANDQQGTASQLRLPGGHERTFNISGVEIFAKSGTAEAPDLHIEIRDEQGQKVKQTIRQGDHGWMICLAKRPESLRPDLAVAVIVEYGGSGGHAAGPIVNQILHALRSEGYL